MSDIFICIGISASLFCVCIVGCSFMVCDKISDLTHELWELRMDLKQSKDTKKRDKHNV